jgi:hypothetical protein
MQEKAPSAAAPLAKRPGWCTFPPCNNRAELNGLCRKHAEQAQFVVWFLQRLETERRETKLWIPGKNI